MYFQTLTTNISSHEKPKLQYIYESYFITNIIQLLQKIKLLFPSNISSSRNLNKSVCTAGMPFVSYVLCLFFFQFNAHILLQKTEDKVLLNGQVNTNEYYACDMSQKYKIPKM